MIESARWCMTNEYDEQTINGYDLLYCRSNPGPYQSNWSCTCKGYQFRTTCKHVKEAEAKRCGFGWEAAAGSPSEMGKTCPECKGSTSVMSYAV